MGAGVLALPFSLSYLSWTWGLLFLAFSTGVSLYCAHLLAELHEASDGTRYNRYKDLGKAILGELFGTLPSFACTQLPDPQHHARCV